MSTEETEEAEVTRRREEDRYERIEWKAQDSEI